MPTFESWKCQKINIYAHVWFSLLQNLNDQFRKCWGRSLGSNLWWRKITSLDFKSWGETWTHKIKNEMSLNNQFSRKKLELEKFREEKLIERVRRNIKGLIIEQ